MSSRRKGENTERDFSHIVELRLPEGGFGAGVYAFQAFHRERGIAMRRGRLQRRDDQEFARWCFADAADADAFAAEFGGVVIQKTKKPRP